MSSTEKNETKIENIVDDVDDNNSDNEIENASGTEDIVAENSGNDSDSSPKKKDKKKKKAKKDKSEKKDKSKKKAKKDKKDKTEKDKSEKDKSKKEKKNKKKEEPIIEDDGDEGDEANASDTETKSTGSNKDAKLKKSDLLDIIRAIPEDKLTPSQKNYVTMFNLVNSLEQNLKDAKASKHITEKDAIADYKKGQKKMEKGPSTRKRTGFSQPYDVPESLKKILDSPDFEEYVVEATPKSGVNAYDKEADTPIITPSQLVDACRNFFIAQDGPENKGHVSLEDENTPVFSIFAEYLENYDNGKLDKNYHPSKGSQDADRSSLSRIQMISFSCNYLKWANEN